MSVSSRRRAFTLIELLVVIAIISDSDRTLAAGRPVGARGGAAGPVHQQHEAVRARHAQLPLDEQQFPQRRHPEYRGFASSRAIRAGAPSSPSARTHRGSCLMLPYIEQG